MTGWDGQTGGPRWWARALGFAVVLGLILGLVGPFGSYLNGSTLARVGYWTGMTLFGTVVIGLSVPWVMRRTIGAGWPRPLGLCVGLVATAIPIGAASAIIGHLAWPRHTAALTPLDWYAQALLIETVVVVLWLLVETARNSTPARSADTVAQEPTASIPRVTGAVICLQMEDHYVRVHRPAGSTLELLTLTDAISRYGEKEGLQVHRSWWVASDAIVAAEPDGRNWRLRLTNGLLVPVARNRVTTVRAAGWIKEREPA